MRDESTNDVAGRLMASSAAGTIVKDIPRLYAPHVVSVHDPANGGVVRGINALTQRMRERQASVEGDAIFADGPYYLQEDGRNLRFAVVFERALTGPQAGPIERMAQLAVFEVEDDLIVREEVFLQPEAAALEPRAGNVAVMDPPGMRRQS